MNEERLVGRRILVVGASAGIGKVVGESLCAAGAHVAFASRRKGTCEEVAKAAGGTSVGLECDVTDETHCARVVDETVDALGGLDDLVYSTGAISMIALADADATWWRRTFETNVMGAALVTRAALPHLQQSTGTAVYLSSVASTGAPWPGIGVYASTKAALNRMIETWRSEHPEIGFTRILVGPTGDAATGAQMDPSAVPHMMRWAGMGVHSGGVAMPASIAHAVKLVLDDDARIPDVTVQPKDGPLPWGV
jgi:NAD(P)-dependent dehydrogenase (short-subunit alcohol dehydrogenase family)